MRKPTISKELKDAYNDIYIDKYIVALWQKEYDRQTSGLHNKTAYEPNGK